MPIKKTVKRRVLVKKVDDTPVPLIKPGAMPLLLYRRIAATFIFVVAAALIAILYLSTVQAVIHIDSTQTPLTAQFITNVVSAPAQEGDVRGSVVMSALGKTQMFPATGESKKQVEGIATGEVTIVNNLTFAQPLVATTRLLSREGVLFRLKEGVVVPAGSSVTAKVYADAPGASGDAEPTRFTIPGLSAVRQVSVYAESSMLFTGGVSEMAVVSQAEIDAAASQLKESLAADAISMQKAQAKESFTGTSYTVEEVERTVSIEPDTQAAQFDVALSVKIATVFFDRDALLNIAKRKLYEALGKGQTFASIYADHMDVQIEDADEASQTANVQVSLSGIAISAQTSEALRADRFVGLDEEAVRSLLINEGVATNVDVEFFPFWIKTVPRLKDHISIDIR